MLNFRKIIGFWLIALPNLALFYVSLWLTIKWSYPEGLSDDRLADHYIQFTVVYLLWLLTFLSFHLFERETFRRYTSLFFSLISATIINLLLAIGYFYLQPELILTPRRFLLVNVLISFTLVLVWDLGLKWFVFKRFVQPVYLFSFNDELKKLEEEIKNHSYLGFRVAGHLSESELKNLSGRSGSLVIFPDNLHTNILLANAIFDLRNKGINFYNHNTFYEQLLRRIYLTSLNEIWFLENLNYDRKIFYSLVKAFFDLIIGLIIFFIFFISFPLIAILIKISSPGPIFFTQNRIGQNGQIYKIYKYRTMHMGHDQNTWTAPNDERITKFGKFLRLSRLDELPQSLNLLFGNMSIVGPRPEQVGIVEQLKQQIPFYDERHIVKPGITGWAQLNIYAATLEETKIKLEYDLYYVKNQSVLFDLEIILKTIYYILRGSGR